MPGYSPDPHFVGGSNHLLQRKPGHLVNPSTEQEKVSLGVVMGGKLWQGNVATLDNKFVISAASAFACTHQNLWFMVLDISECKRGPWRLSLAQVLCIRQALKLSCL